MNVLVTGGAGFIGSHTVRALAERGARVTVLDDFSTGRRSRLDALGAPHTLVEGDVREPGAVARAIAGATHVLHLAARPSVPRSMRDPFGSHDVNATGTVRVLEAARAAGVRRVVVASSSSVYGDRPEPGPKHERLAPRPASPYAASKLATESYALAWARAFGLEAVALRYFNVFGPGQDPDGEYAAVVPRFTRAALAGEPLLVHGDGEQTRDFTYVANAVDANLRALEGPGGSGEALNVACGEASSLNALVAVLARLVGRAVEVRNGPARPGDVRHSLADVSLAREALGYVPLVGFEEGVRRTVESLRQGAHA